MSWAVTIAVAPAALSAGASLFSPSPKAGVQAPQGQPMQQGQLQNLTPQFQGKDLASLYRAVAAAQTGRSQNPRQIAPPDYTR